MHHKFSWNNEVPGWALIDIQSFSALIQRFLRFQRCSELNQPTLILTSLVITDSVMNISEHFWFSAEHYWQAANRQRPWKKLTKSVFLSILMLKRREVENFRITFNWLFWKILKMWFFRNLYFDSMSEDFLLEQKSEKYLNISCNREKNFTGVNFDVFTGRQE